MFDNAFPVTRRQFGSALGSTVLASSPAEASEAVQEAQEAPWNGPAAVKKLYLCNSGGEGWPHPDVDAQKSIAGIEGEMAVLEEQNRNRVRFLKGDLLRPDNDIEAWIKGLPDVDAILTFNRIRPRSYRVDKGGGVDYRRAAAQAAGVSPASR